MSSTRIFKVDYFFTERLNGHKSDTYRENKKVTAKNATEAISKVMGIVEKPYSFVDEETKKKVKVVRASFDPVNVTLEAESEK